jgi:hypothetical protein
MADGTDPDDRTIAEVRRVPVGFETVRLASEIGVTGMGAYPDDYRLNLFTDLRACPDCGQVVNLTEWDAHREEHRAIGDDDPGEHTPL